MDFSPFLNEAKLQILLMGGMHPCKAISIICWAMMPSSDKRRTLSSALYNIPHHPPPCQIFFYSIEKALGLGNHSAIWYLNCKCNSTILMASNQGIYLGSCGESLQQMDSCGKRSYFNCDCCIWKIQKFSFHKHRHYSVAHPQITTFFKLCAAGNIWIVALGLMNPTRMICSIVSQLHLSHLKS